MTEEIINSDGSRNWEANILLDNIKRLEQENKQMKSALEEIKEIAKELCEQKNCEEDTRRYSCHYEDTKNILDKINEVLNDI